MKAITILLTLALVAMCSADCNYPVKVNSTTDTCGKIQMMFGPTKELLMKLNNDLDCSGTLPKDKEICVSEEAPKPCTKVFHVRDYYYCSDISRVFNVTTEELLAANVNLNCNAQLWGGRPICVSQREQPACNYTFTVNSSTNSCGYLMKMFGSTLEQLHRLNNDLDCSSTLPEGKDMCISEEAPKPCTKVYHVREYQYCSSISRVFNITTEELLAANNNLDCNKPLAIGRDICVSQQQQPLCNYTITVNKTIYACDMIEYFVGSTREQLHRLNNNLDCFGLLPQGKEVCVSEEAPKPCTKAYYVRDYSSCSSISRVFNVTTAELLAANVNLDCSKYLWTGRAICVSQKEQPACKNTITVNSTTDAYWKIQNLFGTTKDQLLRLNSYLDWYPSLPLDREICISEQPFIPCKKIYTVNEYDSCSTLAKVFNVTIEELTRINVNLDCNSKISQNRQVCIISAERPCKKTYKVSGYPSCSLISTVFNIPRQQLYAVNKDLNCNKLLTPGRELCLSQEDQPACRNNYTVAEYNNCAAISQMFGPTTEDLHRLNNNLTCSEDLPQGTEVCVGLEAPQACGVSYKVEEENVMCSVIEAKHNVTRAELEALNWNIDCDAALFRGKEVCVSRNATMTAVSI